MSFFDDILDSVEDVVDGIGNILGTPPFEIPQLPVETPPVETPGTPPVETPVEAPVSVVTDADIERTHSNMQNVINIDVVNFFFQPVDKFLQDSAYVMINDLGMEFTFVRHLLYDDVLKMSSGTLAIKEHGYQLGFYKIVLLIVFYLIMGSVYKGAKVAIPQLRTLSRLIA